MIVTEGHPGAPLAVVLGWWGAPKRAVAKFTKLYADRGFSVCCYVAPSRETFGPDAVREASAQRLLRKMRDKWPSSRPGLVFHVMSNNGALMYLAMLRCAKQDKSHQWVLDSIRGVVYDCTPGELTLSKFFKALLATRPSCAVRLAVFGTPVALVLALLYLCSRRPSRFPRLFAFLVAVFLFTHMRDRSSSYHAELAGDPTSCPQLFLYSANDSLVGFHVVEELISRRKQRGIAVTAQRWETSPHMALLMDHPVEYASALYQYLGALGLVVGGPEPQPGTIHSEVVP